MLPHWEKHAGRGPHLLLVHGFLSSPAQWQPNLTQLGAICQPVTVALFGHAGSPSPTDPDCYTPAHYVRCFEQIRQEVGADRWFVLGYSLGAGLTIRYALEHPTRTLGHLFTNSTSGFADAAQLATWRAAVPATVARIERDGRSALQRMPVHPSHARRLPEGIRAALIRDAQLHDPQGIARTLTITNQQVSVRNRAHENQRPACLLFGQREKRFHPHRDFAELHMPDLSIVEIDAGHGMNMEAPEAFNRGVAEFVSRCSTS